MNVQDFFVTHYEVLYSFLFPKFAKISATRRCGNNPIRVRPNNPNDLTLNHGFSYDSVG